MLSATLEQSACSSPTPPLRIELHGLRTRFNAFTRHGPSSPCTFPKLGRQTGPAAPDAFAPTLADALDLLRDVVRESSDGRGAALYVHALHTGVTADTREPH
jgi:hypothetical protein